MRDDVVEASAVLEHPPDDGWQIVGAPEWYSRFAPEISGRESLAQAGRGRGPRCRLRITRARRPMIAGQGQAVVSTSARPVRWRAVPDGGAWVSLALRRAR